MTKESDILDYAKGKQRGKRAHRLERESLNDPFLADALEGFEQSGEHGQAIDELRGLVQLEAGKAGKPRRRSYKWTNYLLAVAAAIMFFLILSPFVYKELKHRQYLSMFEEMQRAPAIDLDEDVIPVTQAHLPVRKKSPHHPVVRDVVTLSNNANNALLADNASSLRTKPLATNEALAIASETSVIKSEASVIASGAKQSNHLIESDLIINESSLPVAKKETLAMAVAQPVITFDKLTAAYPKIIKGKILDETGVALPGAVITQIGTKNAALTDADGKFAIAVEDFDKQLQASFMGYQPMTVSVRDTSKQLLLALSPDVVSLQEVVVTGYGSKKRTRTTGAVPVVKPPEQSKLGNIPEDVYPYAVVEEKPKFMGSDSLKTFIDWVQDRLVYPEVHRESAIQGKVYIKFVIAGDGKLINAIVIKSVESLIDAEALRVVNSSPLWTPGKQAGKPVPVKCTIPLNIDLR